MSPVMKWMKMEYKKIEEREHELEQRVEVSGCHEGAAPEQRVDTEADLKRISC